MHCEFVTTPFRMYCIVTGIYRSMNWRPLWLHLGRFRDDTSTDTVSVSSWFFTLEGRHSCIRLGISSFYLRENLQLLIIMVGVDSRKSIGLDNRLLGDYRIGRCLRFVNRICFGSFVAPDPYHTQGMDQSAWPERSFEKKRLVDGKIRLVQRKRIQVKEVSMSWSTSFAGRNIEREDALEILGDRICAIFICLILLLFFRELSPRWVYILSLSLY